MTSTAFPTRWLYERVLPTAVGILIALIGCGLGLYFFPTGDHVIVPIFLLLSGLAIGYCTLPETADYVGIHAVTLLVAAWLGYTLYSAQFFTNYPSLSNWLLTVLAFNVLYGFIIILGAFLGGQLQKRYPRTWLLPP